MANAPTGEKEKQEPDVAPQPAAVKSDEDSDPDFDDLDDVLDQFSANAPPKQTPKPTPTSSGPGRPIEDAAPAVPSAPVPEGQRPDETEEQFVARLHTEMQTMMSQLSQNTDPSSMSSEEFAKMGKELDDFTRKLEAEGIQPQDLLKAILGEEVGAQVAKDAETERDRRESQSQQEKPEKLLQPSQPTSDPTPSASSSTSPTSTKTKVKSKNKSTNFDETIRRTIGRLETSDTAATNAATNPPKSEEDLLAELLRGLDASGSDGSDPNDLSKMFLSMMEQLTHKDMLYEPMKELDGKFPDWLASHKPPKLPEKEYKRFSNQRAIVREIVAKFEERGYSDEDPACREYVWERMQRMQAEGSPPEDLVSNPLPGMGGLPDLGALGGAGEGEDPGCPTQ